MKKLFMKFSGQMNISNPNKRRAPVITTQLDISILDCIVGFESKINFVEYSYPY